MKTDVGVRSLMIFFVEIIGKLVVLEAIHPDVVVEIDPEEKFGPIYVVPQEWLLVIGDQIGTQVVVVLIEIRHKIVVLVPSGEDRRIHALKQPLPVRVPVLIVVVIHELEPPAGQTFVIELPGSIGDKDVRRVVRIHAERLREQEPGITAPGHVDHPCVRARLTRDPGGTHFPSSSFPSQGHAYAPLPSFPVCRFRTGRPERS